MTDEWKPPGARLTDEPAAIKRQLREMCRQWPGVGLRPMVDEIAAVIAARLPGIVAGMKRR